MKILETEVILALFLSIVVLSACGGANRNAHMLPPANASNRAGENTNAAQTNVEELGLFVNIPYETEDIVWKLDAAQKKVIAVLRFSPGDSTRIVADAERFAAAENVIIPVETWYPGEIIAQSEMSGDGSLKGLAYAANSFHQKPYTTGRIVRIEGSDYFVLELLAR